MLFTLMLVLGGVALLIVAGLLLLWLLLFDAGEAMGGWKPPETGIVILEGLPGSGKSYRAVRWLYDAVRNDRRLVYTNLPVKFRVMRALLRKTGGEHLTRYVVDLSKEHFFRAVARFSELTSYIESQKRYMTAKEAEAAWLDANGPHIPMPMNVGEWITHRSRDGVDEVAAREEFVALASDAEVGAGPDGRLQANWMEYGSAICIDEMHKWCDQRKQKDEDPRIQDFNTMHRHGLFFVLLLSQNAMQVSITFRRNCVKYWRCLDCRNLAVCFGLKLPLPLFKYEEIAAGDLQNDGERTGVKPQAVWTEAPFLNGGLIWRLYSSFTHAGSARKLRQVIERTRQVAEGDRYEPSRTREHAMRVRMRQRWVMRIGWACVALGGVVLAYLGGQGRAVAAPVTPAAPATSSAITPAAPAVQRTWGPTTTPVQPPSAVSRIRKAVGRDGESGASRGRDEAKGASPSLAVLGENYAVIGRQVVRVGQVVDGIELSAVEPDQGFALVLAEGRPFRWFIGDVAPAGMFESATRATTRPAGIPASAFIDAPE